MEISKSNSPLNYKKLYVFSNVVTSCIGYFYFGYQAAVLSIFAGDFSPMGIYSDSNKTSVLLSILPFTAALGAVFAGPLTNKGRRKAFFITDIIAVLGAIIQNIRGYAPFLIGRAICGISVGLNSSIVPLYISEIAPIKERGTYGTFSPVHLCLGLIIGYIVGFGPLEGNDFWWRIMMILPAILSIVRSLTFLTIFKNETPIFSVKNKDRDSAKLILQKIYSTGIEEELKRIEEEAHEQKGKVISYRQLLSLKYRKNFIVCCCLSAFQQLSGINAISYSAFTVFEGSRVGSSMVGVAQLVGGLISTLIIGRFGKRKLLVFGSLMCAIFLFAYAGVLKTDLVELQMVFIFAYIVSFSVSLGSVVWIYIPENVPDIAVSLTTMINWLFAAAVVQIFLITQTSGTPNYVVFGFFCLLSTFFCLRFIIDTNGLPDKRENIRI